MDYLLTLDVGTTAIKTCLFDEAFNIIATAASEYPLSTPQPGYVELDPAVYWQTACADIRAVVSKAGVRPQQVACLTITTQGETLIPVDGHGKALHNAIVWLDTRAAEQAQQLQKALAGVNYYACTGLSAPEPALPAAKVLWIKQCLPEVYKCTDKFLLLEDYLILRFTGQAVSNPSMHSSTGYFDIAGSRYWERMLGAMDVPLDRFPAIADCGTPAGRLTVEAAAACGLATGTTVSTGAMDQIAGAVGAGNVVPGIVTETTGTALVIGAMLAKPDFANPAKPTIYRHCLGASFLLLPYLSTAGVILKWFRDGFCADLTSRGGTAYAALDELAAGVEPGCNGVCLVPDFTASSGGAFCGLTLATSRGHFVRAILESVACLLRENIELMERNGVRATHVRSLGGGAKSRLWTQIKAGVTGKPIALMEQDEATSLGAAILGSVAIGWYASVKQACSKAVRVREEIRPDPRLVEAYDGVYRRVQSLRTGLVK